MKDLAVSIVSWNTRDVLDACLKSVFETTAGIDFEVIVVDNASSDGSAQMVEDKYPQVKVIRNAENVGFSRANNRALELSSSRYFMLLNPDTVCRRGALLELVRFTDLMPSAGVVGPMVLNPDGSLQYSWARFPTFVGEVLGRLDRRVLCAGIAPKTVDDTLAQGPFQTDWVGGCAMMVRRSAIETVGPMDESLFMYCEETDWCRRIKNAGWEVWVDPAARVMHIGGQSSRQTSTESARVLRRSKYAYFAKHHGLVQAVALRALLGVRSALAGAARAVCSCSDRAA